MLSLVTGSDRDGALLSGKISMIVSKALRFEKAIFLSKVVKAVCTRVYRENMFFKKKISATHNASAWGLVRRDPKGFLISTMFRGSLGHLKFDHFYIVDFHSALAFLDRDLRSED